MARIRLLCLTHAGAIQSRSLTPNADNHASLKQHRKPIKDAFYIETVSRAIWQVTVAVLVLAATTWFGLQFVEELFKASFVFSGIGVTKDLSENGYTPTIAAFRLKDALERYERRPESKMITVNDPLLDFNEDATVIVPTLGLSVVDAADTTLHLFHSHRRRRLSGEFTEDDGVLSLRLRADNELVFEGEATPGPGVSQRADALLAKAAPVILWGPEPYVVAANLAADHQVKAAIAAAEAIEKSDRSRNDANVISASVLLGGLYPRDNQDEKAAKALCEAIQSHENGPVLHYNIGALFALDWKLTFAANEFLRAIALDKSYSYPYDGLGNIYLHKGDLPRASFEFAQASHFNNHDAYAYDGLGNVYRQKRRFNKATYEYNLSALLDGKNPDSRVDLGALYDEEGQYSHAIAEYLTAIRISPEDAEAYGDLAKDYGREGDSDKAKAAGERAKEYRPRPPPATWSILTSGKCL